MRSSKPIECLTEILELWHTSVNRHVREFPTLSFFFPILRWTIQRSSGERTIDRKEVYLQFLSVRGRPVETGPWTKSPPGWKRVTRVSDAGSHPELWIAAARESGNGNAASAMITKLNMVVQVWCLGSSIFRALERLSKVMGSIPIRANSFFLVWFPLP